ncbi:hypothetical protein J2T20_003283 [Paenibacillus wynnii]|nr:hypothetical protein [Paenibacillus wynnii]
MSTDEIATHMVEIQRKLENSRPRTIIELPSPHSDKDYGFN